ncbi:MAG: hypothetical protein KA116_13335 [Proteobacteria bacterium]|nr:hypothetical protein [Pseudomonadota bacterium]
MLRGDLRFFSNFDLSTHIIILILNTISLNVSAETSDIPCEKLLKKTGVYARLNQFKILKVRKKPFPEKVGILRATFNPIELPLARHSQKHTALQYEPTILGDLLIFSNVGAGALALGSWALKDTAADPEKLQKEAAELGASVMYNEDLKRLLYHHPDYADILAELKSGSIDEPTALKEASDLAQDKKKNLEKLMSLTESSDSKEIVDFNKILQIINQSKSLKFSDLNLEEKKVIIKLKELSDGNLDLIASYISQSNLKQYLESNDFKISDETTDKLDLKSVEGLKKVDLLIVESLKYKAWNELILDWLSYSNGESLNKNSMNTEFEKIPFLVDIRDKFQKGADPEAVKSAIDNWCLYKGMFKVWGHLNATPLHPKTRKALTIADFESELKEL